MCGVYDDFVDYYYCYCGVVYCVDGNCLWVVGVVDYYLLVGVYVVVFGVEGV